MISSYFYDIRILSVNELNTKLNLELQKHNTMLIILTTDPLFNFVLS